MDLSVSTLGIIIMARDSALSEAQLRANAARQADMPNVRVTDILYANTHKDRRQTLNACLEKRLDEADGFVVLDAALLQGDALRSVLQFARSADADVLYGCAPALRPTADSRRNALAACLHARGVLYIFSEKAVQRMRTADTHDLVGEALSDRSVSAQPIPADVWGGRSVSAFGQTFLLLRYASSLRGVLYTAAAAGLLGAIACLCILLHILRVRHQWDVGVGVGCIACAHLFFWSLGALLILWYRGSVRLEAQAREHPFRKETKQQ